MPPKLRRSKLTSRQFKGLRTLYHQPARADDLERIYKVTDASGSTRKATSNEKYVADALDKLNLEYDFQMSVAGGRTLAFGIVLDFLVHTRPQNTPVWVHGEHWHQGAKRASDIRAMQTVESYGQGTYRKGVEIWGDESNDPQRALMAVRRKIL